MPHPPEYFGHLASMWAGQNTGAIAMLMVGVSEACVQDKACCICPSRWYCSRNGVGRCMGAVRGGFQVLGACWSENSAPLIASLTAPLIAPLVAPLKFSGAEKHRAP